MINFIPKRASGREREGWKLMREGGGGEGRERS